MSVSEQRAEAAWCLFFTASTSNTSACHFSKDCCCFDVTVFVAGSSYLSVIQMFPSRKICSPKGTFCFIRRGWERLCIPRFLHKRRGRTPKPLISLYGKTISIVHQIPVYVCDASLFCLKQQQHVETMESFHQFVAISGRLRTKTLLVKFWSVCK